MESSTLPCYIRQLNGLSPRKEKITVIGYKMNNKKKTKNPQYRVWFSF